MNKIVKKRFLPGSYTIEASFLIPLIVFMIVLIVYLNFFLYDKVLFFNSAYISALRASSCDIKENQKAYHKAKESTLILLKDKIIAIDSFGDKVSVSNKETVILLEGNILLPVPMIAVLFPQQKKLIVSEMVSAKRVDSVSFIRNIRKIKAVASFVREGVDNDIP